MITTGLQSQADVPGRDKWPAIAARQRRVDRFTISWAELRPWLHRSDACRPYRLLWRRGRLSAALFPTADQVPASDRGQETGPKHAQGKGKHGCTAGYAPPAAARPPGSAPAHGAAGSFGHDLHPTDGTLAPSNAALVAAAAGGVRACGPRTANTDKLGEIWNLDLRAREPSAFAPDPHEKDCVNRSGRTSKTDRIDSGRRCDLRNWQV